MATKVPYDAIHRDIVVKDVSCEGITAVPNRESGGYTMKAELSNSSGASGLLITEVKNIIGHGTYRIGVGSLANNTVSSIIAAGTLVHVAEDESPTPLWKLGSHAPELTGTIDVRFCGVTIDKVEQVYVVKYRSVAAELTSHLYSST